MSQVQIPTINAQPDPYGAPYPITFSVIDGFALIRVKETDALTISMQSPNGVYQFILYTSRYTRISVSTNNPNVNVIMQDFDPIIGQTVGPQFTVGFTNGLSSQVYITQTRYVFVTVSNASNNTTVNFWLS